MRQGVLFPMSREACFGSQPSTCARPKAVTHGASEEIFSNRRISFTCQVMKRHGSFAVSQESNVKLVQGWGESSSCCCSLFVVNVTCALCESWPSPCCVRDSIRLISPLRCVFSPFPLDSYSRKSSPSLLAGLILSKTAEVQNSVFAVAFPPRVRRDSSASRGRAPGRLRHGLDSVLDDAEGFVRRARSGQRGARGGGNHGSRRGSGREGAAVGKEWMSAVCHIFGALLLLKVLLTWG